jgi:hypothetical protein
VVENLRKISPRGFKKEMIVIQHKAIDVNRCAISVMGGFQIRKKSFPVPVTLEDGTFFVSS